MDRIAAMTTFVKVVETGSLSAAARALELSQAAVSRQLGGLETHLQTRLLVRTTRRIALTDAGRAYYEQAKGILAAIEDAETALTAKHAIPTGRLTVSASVSFGRLRLAPALPDFIARHPEVTVDLLLLDRVVDLIEEGVDVAIRPGALADSSLIARKIGEFRRVVCAAPDYVERRGAPLTPGDLQQHDCVVSTLLDTAQIWRFRTPDGEVEIPISARLRSNSLDATIAAAVGGAGLVLAPSWLVQDHLAAGRLVAVLEPFEPQAIPIHAVFPHARLMSARVRTFLDFLDERSLIHESPSPDRGIIPHGAPPNEPPPQG
jgi:DNA-binding transcriptional LysR family regulator